jgi:organic radical activating enzyme
MKINTIYLSYQGEVNPFGIGAPVIFVRTGGCHLRCYKNNPDINELCDTPEALEKNSGVDMTIEEIIFKLKDIRTSSGGVSLICLTGGDPLWRSTDELLEFFAHCHLNNFKVTVETSGTLNIANYRAYPSVFWILDYKLKSAAIKQKFIWGDIGNLRSSDFIKFVVYDQEDYTEFLSALPKLKQLTKATIAVGVYWGGKITNGQLISQLVDDKILGQVVINMQAHKLLTHYDLTDVSTTEIPKEL